MPFSESQLLNFETEPRFIPTYEAHEDKFVIFDPVWGECTIGDEPGDKIFLELLDNPLVRRSMAIEQLTLDQTTATIPGTASFSRWEHIWGSVAFVRKMTEGQDMDPRERLILQLRTFVSDLGHTAYSHLGDWMFQGAGGAEDQHDQDLSAMLEASGVHATLQRHGINPSEVIFPDVNDWVEQPAPDLCVDRVDYGAREIKRWLETDRAVWDTLKPEAFKLVDGQIVLKDQASALIFAKAYLLLSTEHWSEPVHRLQLKLQEELVRDVLQHDYLHLMSISPFDYGSFHPRDLLFTIDSDITREMYLVGALAAVVRPVMQDIGATKRRIYSHERREQLATFLREDTPDYPNPLEHYAGYAQRFGPLPLLPTYVSMVPVEKASEVDDFGQNPNGLDFFLPALKPRQIDPLFLNPDGTVSRLSTVDSNYAALLVQHAALLKQAYVARLHVNPETKELITKRVVENDKVWAESLNRPRMPKKVFAEMLHNSVTVSAAYRMIELRWYR